MKACILSVIALLVIGNALDVDPITPIEHRANQILYWSEAISEENGGGYYPGVIRAVKCEGRYCDNQRFRFYEFGDLEDMFLKDEMFTDKSKGSENDKSTCPAPYFVIGWTCEGRYCDDKRLICGKFSGAYAKEVCSNCNWQSFFSEEKTIGGWCPLYHYVTGVKCTGHYCDNLSLQCAQIDE